MKKLTKIFFFACTAFLICMGTGHIQSMDVSAETMPSGENAAEAEENDGWDYENEMVYQEGAFTFYAISSADGTKAWLYEVKISQKKEHSTLSFPEKIEGRKVVQLGYCQKKDKNADPGDKSGNNIFGEGVEPWHAIDGGDFIQGVKKIKIPDTVEVILPTAFSGANDITSITIPSRVKALEKETFYGCDKLKTVYCPAGLKRIDAWTFVDCPNLTNVKFKGKNKTFKSEKECLYTRKDKNLLFVFSKKKNYNIPDGIKSVRKLAFGNCAAENIYIPASVKKIEEDAFYRKEGCVNKKIKNVTVSRKNKIFAKDGQCIYNKKDKSLVIGVIDNNKKLVISEKVENLKGAYCVVNAKMDQEVITYIKTLVLPKKLKTAEATFFNSLSNLYVKKIYFMGQKPPKIIDDVNIRGYYVGPPINSTVYVPKKFYSAFKKWYKDYGEYDPWYTPIKKF